METLYEQLDRQRGKRLQRVLSLCWMAFAALYALLTAVDFKGLLVSFLLINAVLGAVLFALPKRGILGVCFGYKKPGLLSDAFVMVSILAMIAAAASVALGLIHALVTLTIDPYIAANIYTVYVFVVVLVLASLRWLGIFAVSVYHYVQFNQFSLILK
ncbi:MAG: hypothetical protein CMF60_00175 [Magnetococcales bacterium]|nr:hypothetical protein [Magnetococcales bacterium]|tara:strand:- start:8286 stop:8759 length:474 start_codon:yes stop_codon:yes gene_type:complete